MPDIVETGQKWSTWVAGRQQWLLATVIQQKDGRATLKYDTRYGLKAGEDERTIDEHDLLSTPNMFRHVAAESPIR
jgi:hypothetical protein